MSALRAGGLRKKAAKTFAQATGRAKRGDDVPKGARKALSGLKSVVGDLEDRLTGGPAKRSASARKAARTRKRKAERRSAAAAKGAKTRTAAKRAKPGKAAKRGKTAAAGKAGKRGASGGRRKARA